jgi:hypothetical protein
MPLISISVTEGIRKQAHKGSEKIQKENYVHSEKYPDVLFAFLYSLSFTVKV